MADKTQIPFLLQSGEKVLRVVKDSFFYGIGIVNFGTFAGGSGSVFGGVSSSTTKKREKSIWDSHPCFGYLTNQRLVFVALKHDQPEKVSCTIPLDLVEAANPGTKLSMPTVDISVKQPTGEVNVVSFDLRPERTGFFGRKPRNQERDDWIVEIKKVREDYLSAQSKSKTNSDDPLAILRIRYAKGEISKAEYEEMQKLLNQ